MNSQAQILVVDDNIFDVELTLAALKELELPNQVDIVRDGEEALEYLLREERYENRSTPNPALVLLDIKMIKVDGIEVLKIVKEYQNLINIPIVILTSSSLEKDVEASYLHGVNAYVVKPSHFEDFIEMMKNLLVFFKIVE